MAMRMTGLISGMDTESMVKELVSANSEKVNKIKQKKQDAEWKKEIWSGLNTKIYNFYKTQLSAFKTVSNYKTKKATVSDETKVSVKAGSGATNGTHSVSVEQTASSAYLTGDNIKKYGKTYTTYNDAGLSTKFEDMVDADGNSLNLKGQTISFSEGTETIEFVLGGEGENGVASLSELNEKLAANENFKGLSASIKDGKLTFGNATAKTNDSGDLVGTTFFVNADAFGLSGVISYNKDADGGNTKSVDFTAKVKQDFTSADISTSTKLADLGIKVGTTFSVNGQDFVVDDKSTIDDFTTALSKMGVSASFDAAQGRFYINASKTGAANDFNVTSSDSNALDILGLGSEATKVDARDAIIYYNNVKYTSDSNTMTINGMTITAKAKTDTAVNIEVAADTDAAYDNVKKFVKAYNELIDEMNKYYNEKDAGYDALTDDEKSKLSDTQIEKWEEKAKQGLLRRDDTLQTLLTNMRSTLNKGVTVTLADGSTRTMTLASIGIVTGDYSENGKLHILGDEDDEEYASQENKLRAALEGNDDLVSQIIGGTSENKGVGTQLYDYLRKSMTRIEGVRSTQTFYNDKTMDSEIDDYEDEIDKWEEKLQDLEDKYYNQFSKMESAMAKLQSQQSYLTSLFGG
ncbi:flagellar filament capping protein FliD [Eubacterium sp. MSJ-33]|uniref:flagellar filament capping protein FliD n=1 Tax=Eubacterium sp. MSJ-33 TaxID=2841528 RepID=UPI001C7869D9|nr:flagellar filament capping protein FliD [Eubacterium sp. MSJ-33]QWT52168.1 flagellar filament capping protein FliD [Eubacterium sp. MSJ-33]